MNSDHPMLPWLKWIGSITGIAGALTIALNLPISGWGFIAFLASSTAWLAAATIQRDTALALGVSVAQVVKPHP